MNFFTCSICSAMSHTNNKDVYLNMVQTYTFVELCEAIYDLSPARRLDAALQLAGHVELSRFMQALTCVSATDAGYTNSVPATQIVRSTCVKVPFQAVQGISSDATVPTDYLRAVLVGNERVAIDGIISKSRIYRLLLANPAHVDANSDMSTLYCVKLVRVPVNNL